MHLILSSDNNYAPLLGVAIYTILKNNRSYLYKTPNNKIIFHILDMNISENNKNLMRDMVEKSGAEIYFIDTSDIHQYLEKTIKLKVRSIATYYRLFLSSLLDASIDKAIYLDCDSMVNDTLEELWDTDISGYDIAGVLDIISAKNKKCIGLKEEEPYFNAGMLLINLKKWRKDNIEQKMIDFVQQHDGKVCYHDQGTINGVCVNKKILHPRYNAMTPFFVMTLKQLKHYHSLKNYYTEKELLEARKKPVFIHFTPYLTDRPWVKGNLHPLRKLYQKQMAETPWKGTQFDKPSQTLEPWVKWLFFLLPYPIFVFTLRTLQKFKPKSWIKNLISKK